MRINNLLFSAIRSLLAVSLLCVTAGIAFPDSITRTFSFTASGFPPDAPVDPVNGSFTVSLDSTVTSFGSVDSFTSNLVFLGPVDYIFRPLQNFGELTIGTSCSLASGCSASSGHNDLIIDIFGGATLSPSLQTLAYSTTSTSVLESSTSTLSFTEAVPEPSCLFLFCVGVASLFGLREVSYRRNSRRAQMASSSTPLA